MKWIFSKFKDFEYKEEMSIIALEEKRRNRYSYTELFGMAI